MRHWLIEVCGENILALGYTEEEAKHFAIRKYFDLHPEKLGKVWHLTTPCQWEADCPYGEADCRECFKRHREE